MTSHRNVMSLRRSAATGLIVTLGLCGALASPGEARREMLTDAQKGRLHQAERIQLDVLALTDQGTADPSPLRTAVTTRLQALGYTIVQDPAQPHDLVVKVKCEQKKTWEGPVRSGGEADQPGDADRLWAGPACQFTYRLDHHWSDWRHEVRATAPPETGPQSLAHLTDRLREDPFPFLLAAEWGQPARLLVALNEPATTAPHRVNLISLLGNMFAVEAIPPLSQAVKDPDPAVAQTAAVALGTIGHHDCIPVLLELLKSETPAMHLAAIKGLGRLAPLHPQDDIVPALLDRLPTRPIAAQIEIVRALGKTTDRRILVPLRALNRSVQARSRSDSSAELKELKTALGIALDQFDGTHTPE